MMGDVWIRRHGTEDSVREEFFSVLHDWLIVVNSVPSLCGIVEPIILKKMYGSETH